MCAAPSSIPNFVKPIQIETAKELLKVAYPGIKNNHLEKLAADVACQSILIASRYSQSHKGLIPSPHHMIDFIKALPQEEQRVLQSVGFNFEESEDVFLKKNQPSPESSKEKPSLQEQTCKVCNTPNRRIKTETEEIKYLLKKCSVCKEAMYCSVACQSKDWKNHKIECIKK